MARIDLGDGTFAEVVDEGDPNDPLALTEDPNEVAARAATGAEDELEGPGEEDEDGSDEDAGEEDESEDTESDEDEDDEDLEDRLDSYLEDQVRAKLTPELQGRDRRITALQRQAEEQKAQIDQLLRAQREQKLVGLTPEEQERMRRVWEQDDREASLDEYKASLDELAEAIMIQDLVQEYAAFGVTPEALEGMSEADATAFCKDAELQYWRDVASGKRKAPTEGAAPSREKKTTAARTAPARKAPAGASAPTDVGGAGGAPTGSQKGQPSEGQGIEAMAATMENLGWETVPLGRRR